MLEKETRKMSLWLMISLQSEKRRDKSLILIYITTLGESFAKLDSLAKMSQFGWLGIPTKGIPSQFSKLGIDLMVVEDSSWMKIMLKS